MLDAMGDYPLEFRIGLIVLNAANADGEVSDEEYEEIAVYMQDTLEKLGVNLSAQNIIKNCYNEIENKEIFDESVQLLGEYLSAKLLAKLLNDIWE